MSDEMMKAWEKFMTPGEQHQFLSRLQGTWHAKCRFWMGPDGEPQESEGTQVNEMLFGGRYLRGDFKGETPWGPFEGMSLDGFDNQQSRFVGTWCDSMGTGVMLFTGDLDASGKVLTMVADCPDMVSGEPTQKKGVTTIRGDDEHVYESFNKTPDGHFFRTMEIVYTRR